MTEPIEAARSIVNRSLESLAPVARKYIIRCRHCSHLWSDKAPFTIGDTASSFCPSCGTRNTWSHSAFKGLTDKPRLFVPIDQRTILG